MIARPMECQVQPPVRNHGSRHHPSNLLKPREILGSRSRVKLPMCFEMTGPSAGGTEGRLPA